MLKSVRSQKGNTVVAVTVVAAISLTSILGFMELAANYSKQASKERRAAAVQSQKQIALQYLLGKFTTRSMADENQGTEWSIQNLGGRVKVSANSSYCYQVGCGALTDPQKVPIRDIYSFRNEAKECVSLGSYQREFTGAAAEDICSPYDEYVKDKSNLASVQTDATLEPNEKQKAYLTIVDLDKFTKAQQDQYLAGTLSTQETLQGFTPIRVALISYEPKTAPDSDIITVEFDDGEQGKVWIPKTSLPDVCGKPEVDHPTCLSTKAAKFCGCYDKAELMAKGAAKLSDGTEIVLTQAGGNFKVWKEKRGNRILKPTGLWAFQSDWQKTLTRAGTAFTSTDFTNISQIAGRACPQNVFLNHRNMVEVDQCLYYDIANAKQLLRQQPGIEAEDWLGDWNRPNTGRGTSSSYFEGNIKTCADKGMRLPTVYEAGIGVLKGNFCDGTGRTFLPTGDNISPKWATATEGVPSTEFNDWFYSASADLENGSCGGQAYVTYGYWGWYSNKKIGAATFPFSSQISGSVRCVIPSSPPPQIAGKCGNPELDNAICVATKAAKFCGCYDKEDVLTSGTAKLSDGTEIVLTQAGGSFKVWKEKQGNRILKPTGLWASQDDWQKTLTRAGTTFTATNFTNVSQIAGRACPPNVFLNHNQMIEIDRCVYYDNGSSSQRLDASGLVGSEASDWIQYWNRSATGRGTNSSYFEGNIKVCADKGMRLPTLYETELRLDPGYWDLTIIAPCLPKGDSGIQPKWANSSDGVPTRDLKRSDALSGVSYESIPWGAWTATADSCHANYAEFTSSPVGSNTFFATSGGGPYYSSTFPVRCILP